LRASARGGIEDAIGAIGDATRAMELLPGPARDEARYVRALVRKLAMDVEGALDDLDAVDLEKLPEKAESVRKLRDSLLPLRRPRDAEGAARLAARAGQALTAHEDARGRELATQALGLDMRCQEAWSARAAASIRLHRLDDAIASASRV